MFEMSTDQVDPSQVARNGNQRYNIDGTPRKRPRRISPHASGHIPDVIPQRPFWHKPRQSQSHPSVASVLSIADTLLARFNQAGGDHKILERTSQRASIELGTGRGRGRQTHIFSMTWPEAQQEEFPWTDEANSGEVAKRLHNCSVNPAALKPEWATERGRMQMLWECVVGDGVATFMPAVALDDGGAVDASSDGVCESRDSSNGRGSRDDSTASGDPQQMESNTAGFEEGDYSSLFKTEEIDAAIEGLLGHGRAARFLRSYLRRLGLAVPINAKAKFAARHGE